MSEEPNTGEWNRLADRLERLCEDIEKLLKVVDSHDLRLREVEKGLVRVQTIAAIAGAIGAAALSVITAKLFGGGGG